jgi:hypothetical protein
MNATFCDISGDGSCGVMTATLLMRSVPFSRSPYKTMAYSMSAKNTNTIHESSHTSIAFTLIEGGAVFLKIDV